MKIGILLAGLGLGVVMWWGLHQSDTGKTPATSDAPRLAESSLEGAIVNSQPRVPARPIPRPSVTSSSSEPVAQAASDAGPEITVAERRVHLQSRFAAQDVDPGWASTARQELGDDLRRSAGKDVRVQDVECRSSLCRAELVLTSHEAGNAFMESWLHQRAWTGPGFVANDEASPDGTPRMIMFLGRPGTELPHLE